MRLLPAVVASIFALAACAAPMPEAAEDLHASSQPIVGGTPSTTAQNAAVLLNEAGAPGCSGTLIAPNLVLTARHCVAYFNANDECGAPLRGEIGPSLITVSVGVHATPQSWVARATKFFVPAAQELCSADIALVALDNDVKGVKPATVRFSAPTVDELGTAVGYGDQGTGRRQREGVKVLALGPVNASYTTANGQSLPMRLPANELATTESTCYGDSGGPLFDSLGQVIGVASRGLDDLCNDRPTYWTTLAAHEQLVRDAAAAVGHPLAAATPPPTSGRNTATGDPGAEDNRTGNDDDDGDNEGDEKRTRKRDASIGSAGCSVGPVRPGRSLAGLGLLLSVAASLRRRRPCAALPPPAARRDSSAQRSRG
ncbi:MAG: hypothetical protein K0S65_1781 [Labilithrix sp.]|nr:hypothetical protein [Labilithrix sp.]